MRLICTTYHKFVCNPQSITAVKLIFIIHIYPSSGIQSISNHFDRSLSSKETGTETVIESTEAIFVFAISSVSLFMAKVNLGVSKILLIYVAQMFPGRKKMYTDIVQLYCESQVPSNRILTIPATNQVKKYVTSHGHTDKIHSFLGNTMNMNTSEL